MSKNIIFLILTGLTVFVIWLNYKRNKKKEEKLEFELDVIEKIEFEPDVIEKIDFESDYEDDDNIIESFSDESKDKFLDWKSMLIDLNKNLDKNFIIYDSYIREMDESNSIKIIDKRNHNNRFYIVEKSH